MKRYALRSFRSLVTGVLSHAFLSFRVRYLLSQSSTATTSGLNSPMARRTSATLSGETWAVPTRRMFSPTFSINLAQPPCPCSRPSAPALQAGGTQVEPPHRPVGQLQPPLPALRPAERRNRQPGAGEGGVA